jgi:hypothetical protein
MSWGEMLAAATRDRTNPPLFYALLKLWIGVGGTSVAWMRLLPCMFGIAAAVPMVALARRAAREAGTTSDERARSLSIAVIAAGAASPLAVFLSNEVRGYSLLLLLSGVSLVATWRVVETLQWETELRAEGSAPNGLGDVAPERRRRIVQLALVNVLLVYTHYFGWLLIAAELVAAVLWHRRAARWLVGAAGGAAVCFAPWAIAVAMNAAGAPNPLANVGWVTVPAVGDVPLFFDALVARVLTVDAAWVGALVMILVCAAAALSARQRVVRELALIALLPVALAWAGSVLTGRSAFVPRYLLIVAPAWWLIAGLGVVALGGFTARGHRALEVAFRVRATAIAFAAFTLAAGALREVRGGEKIPWDRLVAAVAADAGPAGGTIYSLEGFTALPAAYYAAQRAAGLAVRPVGDLRGIQAPAWLVVRADPSGRSAGLGDGLTPTGLALTLLRTERIPSQRIIVYRVSPGPVR